MKKINILKKNIDFQRIIKTIKPYKYKNYIIYIERIKSENYCFGISVGTKIGKAVTRNKIRRQIKHILDQNNYQKGFNCIIIVKKQVISISFLEMKKELFEILAEIDVLKEND